jgi:hypothetical protein
MTDTSHPGDQPERLALAAGVARASEKEVALSSRVRIVNNPRNTRGIVRRRDARFFLDHGRARYLGRDIDGQDQIALVESDVLNKAQASEAAAGYEWPVGKVVTREELLNIGIVRRTGSPAHVGRGVLGRLASDRSIVFTPSKT